MANIYVSSASYAAVATWAASTAYTSTANGGRGSYVRQLATPAVGSERVFRCTTSGTSLASEPSWTLTKNSTTTEAAGPVWTECTGQEADQVSGTWKAPHARLFNAIASTWGAAGDNFYVGGDHAETQSTSLTLVFPGTSSSINRIFCVSETGSVPPVAADLQATATITTTGNSPMILSSGYIYINGITFRCGSGAVNSTLKVLNASGFVNLENCALEKLGTTGSSSALDFGLNSASGCLVIMKNTRLKMTAQTDSLILRNVEIKWSDTTNAISVHASANSLFTAAGTFNGTLFMDGVDLSAISSVLAQSGGSAPRKFHYKDCKLAAGVSIQGNATTLAGFESYVMRSDSSGTNYRNEKYTFVGTLTTELNFVRTGGASDGSTPISWKNTNTVNSSIYTYFELFPIAIWNPATSANVTVTIEGFVAVDDTIPSNEDIWLDVSYLGSSSSTQATIAYGGKSNPLASPTSHSASTEAWDSAATARQNSTAYTGLIGMFKVASNPGRLFFCTSSGTTAASEPAGYATCVDGGSVTDGTATFRAVSRFKMAVTLSSPQPAQAGLLYANVKSAKGLATFYIDPLIKLS